MLSLPIHTSPRGRYVYPRSHGARPRLLLGRHGHCSPCTWFGFRWLKDHPTVPKQDAKRAAVNAYCRGKSTYMCSDLARQQVSRLHRLARTPLERHRNRRNPRHAASEELRTHLWSVTWFPDGEKLLFTADSKADGYSIWMTSVFGGAPRKLRDDGQWPVVSPQGSLIAFVGGHDHEIWVMGANGENPHRVLGGENEVYAALAWSPTGRASLM